MLKLKSLAPQLTNLSRLLSSMMKRKILSVMLKEKTPFPFISSISFVWMKAWLKTTDFPKFGCSLMMEREATL